MGSLVTTTVALSHQPPAACAHPFRNPRCSINSSVLFSSQKQQAAAGQQQGSILPPKELRHGSFCYYTYAQAKDADEPGPHPPLPTSGSALLTALILRVLRPFDLCFHSPCLNANTMTPSYTPKVASSNPPPSLCRGLVWHCWPADLSIAAHALVVCLPARRLDVMYVYRS